MIWNGRNVVGHEWIFGTVCQGVGLHGQAVTARHFSPSLFCPFASAFLHANVELYSHRLQDQGAWNYLYETKLQINFYCDCFIKPAAHETGQILLPAQRCPWGREGLWNHLPIVPWIWVPLCSSSRCTISSPIYVIYGTSLSITGV